MEHLFPFYDEVWYLDHARTIHSQGLPASIDDYLTGKNREDNQHPLYLIFLSLFMDGTARDFTRAKLLSYAQCLAILMVLMTAAYRLGGQNVSLACGGLFSFSSATVHLSQMILADLLFGLIFFLTCWWLTKREKSVSHWLGIGLLCGFAYLTKANGYLLLIIAIAVAVNSIRIQRHINASVVWVMSGFFIVAGFLLWRNILLWHNPLHHLNNKVIWLNDWQEYFLYNLTPQWNDIGMKWYFAHHSLLDAGRRFGNGAFRQSQVLLEGLAFVSFENRWRFAIGGTIALLSMVALIRRFKNGFRQEVIVMLSGIIIIFVPFSFFVEQTIRYIFPIALILMLYASMEAGPWFRTSKSLAGLLLVGAMIGMILARRDIFQHSPLSLYKVPAYWQQTTDWIERNAPRSDYAIDTWSPYSEWHCCADRRRPVPYQIREDWLRLFIEKNNLRLALVDTIRMGHDSFKEKYGPKDEHGPISFLGWPRVFADDGKPSHFLIYGAPDQPNPSAH